MAAGVNFDDVVAAAARIEGRAHRTPVMTSRLLDESLGASLFFKCENLQRTGAFKFRGAFNAISRLDDATRARGVLAYSSGNHAQAVALVCQMLGIPATIVMPSDAPGVKREATVAYGAQVIDYDRATQSREDLARTLLAERGLHLIPPFDHPHIVAGQGTATYELLREVPDLDLVLTPCGGGGLLSGSAIAAKGLSTSVRVIGVEPALADDATRSYHSGTLQSVENPQTIADGTRTHSMSELTFSLVRHWVDDMLTVGEDTIVQATRLGISRLKMLIEPSGALPLAALLEHGEAFRGLRIGLIVSGGNVDLRALGEGFGRA